MPLTLPPSNWAIAHALEAVGVVGLFVAFDALLCRAIEPGFYLFLFALWFSLSLVRYHLYAHRSAVYRRMAAQPVATQLWWTSDTFVWVVFILLAFALYETMVRPTRTVFSLARPQQMIR